MGKLFFPKTAAGNLVRNRRFFYPYLLTGLLTVAMFYNIAFLNWHKELRNLPGGSTIPSIMSLGMIVVALFAIIFLLYTNSFLIKRRHKEIGLYNILGLSKGHIALVLFWETVYTCLITIAGGQPVPVVTCGHGTAYDIAGKNIVHTTSFENAIKMASQMAVHNK